MSKKTLIENNKKVYLITYKLYLYGSTIYDINGQFEKKYEYFIEREEFLKRYKELKEQETNSIYYKDIEVYIGILSKIENVEERINQIENIL